MKMDEKKDVKKTQPKAEIIKETSKTGRAIASFQDPKRKQDKNIEPQPGSRKDAYLPCAPRKRCDASFK
jgi:hypothetical protein